MKGNAVRKLIILPGDGIGPEVIAEARRIIDWFGERGMVDVSVEEREYGIGPFEKQGRLMSEATLADVVAADAVLFGATGGPGYEQVPREIRQSQGLLRIRKELGVYINLRPIRGYPALADCLPLKPEVVEDVDLVVVRELNGGIYFGEPRGIEEREDRAVAVNTLTYDDIEITRIARAAFALARSRGVPLTSVDKSNVLETSALWRRVVERVGQEEFPDVQCSHILVDNCAMQMVRAPSQFDVLLADNMFGDILSDIGGAISGSLGMLPSASLNDGEGGRHSALYEPVHGSAPDIAGRGLANPIGAILSMAMCFRHSFNASQAARKLEAAVDKALASGVRTPDIAGPDDAPTDTRGMGDAILDHLTRHTG